MNPLLMHPIYDQMKICKVCRFVYGPLKFVEDNREFYQPCECNSAYSWRNEKSLQRAFNLDLDEIITLCYSCGTELISSGTRWSVWFCKFCKEKILQFNSTELYYAPIPIGRHSMMNGISLNLYRPGSMHSIPSFVQGVNSLFNRQDHLWEWRKLIVAKNCELAGLPTDQDVNLVDYLKATSNEESQKMDRILELVEFFKKKYKPKAIKRKR